MGVRISVIAPKLCNTSVSGLDEYADGCLFEKGTDWTSGTLFVRVGAPEGGCEGGGGGQGSPKVICAYRNQFSGAS